MTHHEGLAPLPSSATFVAPSTAPEVQYGDLLDDRWLIRVPLRAPSDLTSVYLAHDGADGNTRVALKLFHEPDGLASHLVDREIAAHALADGKEGVVPLHDAGTLETANGTVYRYLATEYIAGGNLSEQIRASRAEDDQAKVKRAVQVGDHILQALTKVHAVGIVHRDVTPNNVLQRRRDGRFVLSDFGIADPHLDQANRQQLAQLVGEQIPVAVCEESTLPCGSFEQWGTAGYIPSESIHDGIISPANDVYASAATIYRTLTGGEKPFYFSDAHDYASRAGHEPILPPTTYNRAVPRAISRAIVETLASGPKNRPTAVELRDELLAASV